MYIVNFLYFGLSIFSLWAHQNFVYKNILDLQIMLDIKDKKKNLYCYSTFLLHI